MPKSPPPSRRGGAAAGRGGSSRRAAPTKISKPFPWGVALGSAVLALALIGLLVYAVMNQGGGVSNPDDEIAGVVVADEEALSRNHVEGAVDYPQEPPNGGDHNGVPQQCAVYTEAIAPEHAVHSLEHGAVWATYNDDATEGDVETLTERVEGDPYRMLSPDPEQDSPVVLTAWGRTLELDSADDGRLGEFFDAYTNGRQTPEPGAACAGNTSTGPIAPAAPAPAASAPAAPAPAASDPAASAPATPAP